MLSCRRSKPTWPAGSPYRGTKRRSPAVTLAGPGGGARQSTVLIKRCPYPAAQEADGLRALAAAGAPAPGVLGVGGLEKTPALEWLQGEPDWPALARGVAGPQRHTADRSAGPPPSTPGASLRTTPGPTAVLCSNVRHPLLPQLNRATKLPLESRHLISQPLPAHSRRYCGRIHPPRSPTGTCGRANTIRRPLAGRSPRLSYADRELDLAYLSLSDDLPPEFMTAYLVESPVSTGYSAR